MGRKGNKITIVPFLQDALDNNKYPSYLMYTDKENSIFNLILPRMTKNIKEEDMQLLKDWHATKGEIFDYKKVKQSAINTLKRSCDEVEMISNKQSQYTFRMLPPSEPAVPIPEFVQLPWKLCPLQRPIKYEPSVATKGSPYEILLHIKELFKFDKTHSNFKNLIKSFGTVKKSFHAVSRQTSTPEMLKLFADRTVLQGILENCLRSYLKVQSFIKEILDLNNKPVGFPIPGLLLKRYDKEEWEKMVPKLMVIEKEKFPHQEYPSVEELLSKLNEPQLSEPQKGLFEFAEQFFLIDDQMFQEILHMRKQSIESASLIEKVQKEILLPKTSTIENDENSEDEPEKCFLNELLFPPDTDEGNVEDEEGIKNRIAELLEELQTVSSLNCRQQDRLLVSAIQGKKKQRIKAKIRALDISIYETYRNLLSKTTEVTQQDHLLKMVRKLDRTIKKRVELVLEIKNMSHVYADEELETEMENNLSFELDVESKNLEQKILEVFNQA